MNKYGIKCNVCGSEGEDVGVYQVPFPIPYSDAYCEECCKKGRESVSSILGLLHWEEVAKKCGIEDFQRITGRSEFLTGYMDGFEIPMVQLVKIYKMVRAFKDEEVL